MWPFILWPKMSYIDCVCLCVFIYIKHPGESPKATSKGKIASALGATTSLGTKGGVRYLDVDEEPRKEKGFKGEERAPKASPRTSPAKRDSSSRSPVRMLTTPPPQRRQATPTTTGKAAIPPPQRKQATPTITGKATIPPPQRGQATPTTTSKSAMTTPKKSTPQSGPSSSVAAGGSGTTPSMSRAQSFLRYKNRAGPRAPGSKEIPQGKAFTINLYVQQYQEYIVLIMAGIML